MKLGRLNHVGVATKSIDASIAMYRDLMGATVTREPFDLPEQGVKVCFVDTPGADGALNGTQIELVEPLRREGLLRAAYVIHRPRQLTFLLRLVRDLRERRKPPGVLIRRGWALMQAEPGVVAAQVARGAVPRSAGAIEAEPCSATSCPDVMARSSTSRRCVAMRISTMPSAISAAGPSIAFVSTLTAMPRRGSKSVLVICPGQPPPWPSHVRPATSRSCMPSP